MTFTTMYPHIRGTAKKIVAVTFEDGTTINVDEADLRGYIRIIDAQSEDAFFRKAGLNRETLKFYRGLWAAERTLQASKNASKPRKHKTLSKASIQKYKTNFEERYKKTRGWLKSAAAHFKVSTDIIRKRIGD